jgi:small subunit ribosomal protein S9
MATEMQYYEGVGRRKSATARVRIYPGGSGEYIVNDKPLAEYFTRLGDASRLMQPLAIVEIEGKVDMTVRVKGGGVTGQTGAVQLGLARALLKYDPELRPALRKAGLLTRDAREKERKKPGLKRARKAPTYTKR